MAMEREQVEQMLRDAAARDPLLVELTQELRADDDLAPKFNPFSNQFLDSRPADQRLRDHERLRGKRGAMLAARLGPEQTFPPFQARHYPGDCGYDLNTTEDVDLHVNDTADIPCGVAVALPPLTFGWIAPRSSTWSKWRLMVMPGIIDEGWRGELFTMVWRPPVNGQPDVLHVPAGTRLAQLILMPNMAEITKMYRVHPDDLPGSERGTNGFGSTG